MDNTQGSESKGSKYIESVERWLGEADSSNTAQIFATLVVAEQTAAVAQQLARIADALEAITTMYASS